MPRSPRGTGSGVGLGHHDDESASCLRCDRRPAVQADGAMTTLKTRAWLGLVVLAFTMALLLIVPAWSLHYWQAWVYLSIFTGASVLTTLYLMRHAPELLERRVRSGPTAERQPAQKLIMLAVSVGFIALLVVPALDHRFGWSALPLAGVVLGDILVAVGFYFIFLVYRENTFTSATI